MRRPKYTDMAELADDGATTERIEAYTDRLAEITEMVGKARDADDERAQALMEEQRRLATEMDALKHVLANTRAPSKAHLIGGNYASGPTRDGGFLSPQSDGTFLKAVMLAGSRHAHEQAEGRAYLESMTRYDDGAGKATLGSTDATGGWIAPNGTVDDLVKPGQFLNPYFTIMSTVTGVNAGTVDIPLRTAAAARALVIGRGVTKTNIDLVYNGYSATMYTIAQIADVANQFLRQSAGAAERDVKEELAQGFALGSAFYIREGAGTTEPLGITTALSGAPGTFTTSHTAAANTVAGNVAAAIGKAAGALLGRNRQPTAAVMSASGYTEILTTGSDTAGFFIAGLDPSGVQSPFSPGTLVSPFGIPIYVDTGMAADDLWVGDFKAFRIYLGDRYRVDVSSEAGERFDKNLTGFRAEAELGFDARPGVYAGALQVVADILS